MGQGRQGVGGQGGIAMLSIAGGRCYSVRSRASLYSWEPAGASPWTIRKERLRSLETPAIMISICG
jgi:hypothetical protein